MTGTSTQVARELGRIDERLKHCEENDDAARHDLRAIRADVAAIKSEVDKMKGGKAALLGLLTVAGGLGAFITKMIEWVRA